MTASPGPHVGLPSEEEALAAYNAVWQNAPEIDAHNVDIVRREAMAAVYALIRPAFEAQQAKLAQAVEALEPFDDALGEDDEGYGGGLTVVMKWGACSVYSVTLEDLRDLRRAVRVCEDRLDEASAASAAARGETR